MTQWSFTLLRALPALLCIACAEPDAYTCDPTTTNCFTYPQTRPAGNTAAPGSTTTGGVVVSGGATTAGSTNITTGGATTGGTATTTTGGGGTTTAGGGGTGTTTTTGGLTSPFSIENFSNTAAFMNNLNTESPPNYMGQGNVTTYTLNASTGQLELDCNNNICYWWCALTPQGSCINITGFTHFEVTLQGPPGADGALQLQQNDSTCQSPMFTAFQNSAPFSSYMTFDNLVHTIYIPLTAYPNIQQQYTRAIAIVNLPPNMPIYINTINLVKLP